MAKWVDYALEVRGLEPGMLCNPMAPETLNNIRTKTSVPVRRDWAIEEEAATKVPKDREGNIALPAGNFFKCIINAGRFEKIGRKAITMSSGATQVPAFLKIKEPYLRLTDGNGGEAKWVADLKRGADKKSGEARPLTRPLFLSWGFKTVASVNKDVVNPETVKKLIELAGMQIGLGSNAPRTGGQHGQFELLRFEEVNDKES